MGGHFTFLSPILMFLKIENKLTKLKTYITLRSLQTQTDS